MSATYLFLQVIAAAVGTGYFIYGKKRALYVPLLCGIALCVVPMFIESLALLVIAVGILLLLPWLIK